MLKNVAPAFPDVVEALKESPFEFYLTGSRAFNDPQPNDWDFYVADDGQQEDAGHPFTDKSLRTFLRSKGFMPITWHNKYADDPNIAEVWAHLPEPTHLYVPGYDYYNWADIPDYVKGEILSEHADVHVQIVEDIEARHVCNNIMKTTLLSFYQASPKSSRRQLWRALFEAYKKGKFSEVK